MATVKKPAAKKAAKPAVKTASKKPLAVKTAEAKVELAKAVVKQVTAAENLKAVDAKIKKTAAKPTGNKVKNAGAVSKLGSKKNTAALPKGVKIRGGEKITTIYPDAVVSVKVAPDKKAAKKISKVDKLMKVPAPAPLTAGQQSAVSVATAALKMRQQQFADSNSRPATQAVAQAPVEKFQRPAPSPVSNDGLSFKERLRQAESRRVDGQQAFLNRLQAAQRS